MNNDFSTVDRKTLACIRDMAQREKRWLVTTAHNEEGDYSKVMRLFNRASRMNVVDTIGLYEETVRTIQAVNDLLCREVL